MLVDDDRRPPAMILGLQVFIGIRGAAPGNQELFDNVQLACPWKVVDHHRIRSALGRQRSDPCALETSPALCMLSSCHLWPSL